MVEGRQRCGCGRYGKPLQHEGYCSLRDGVTSPVTYTPVPFGRPQTKPDMTTTGTLDQIGENYEKMGLLTQKTDSQQSITPAPDPDAKQMTLGEVQAWWELVKPPITRRGKGFGEQYTDFVNTLVSSGQVPGETIGDFMLGVAESEIGTHDLDFADSRPGEPYSPKTPEEMFNIALTEGYRHEPLLYSTGALDVIQQHVLPALENRTPPIGGDYLKATLIQRSNISPQALYSIYYSLTRRERKFGYGERILGSPKCPTVILADVAHRAMRRQKWRYIRLLFGVITNTKDDRLGSMMESVAKNPNTPVDVLQDIVDNPLYKKMKVSPQRLVASRKDIPQSMLRQLLTSDNVTVLKSALVNPLLTDESVLAKFAQDDNPEILERVLANPNHSEKVFEHIMERMRSEGSFGRYGSWNGVLYRAERSRFLTMGKQGDADFIRQRRWLNGLVND